VAGSLPVGAGGSGAMRSSPQGATELFVQKRSVRALGPRLQLMALLDEVDLLLRESESAPEGIRILTNGLQAVKNRVSCAEWIGEIIATARQHPVDELIRQCPLTSHARSRPRGYPGDAGLLDLIYRHPSTTETILRASPTGKAIYDFTIAVPACEAVRERCRLVARKIDELAASKPGAGILSVACGHVREAQLSEAMRLGATGSFIALDQDPISLDVVQGYAAATACRIETRKMAVRHLLTGRDGLPSFDLIYSMGLYDYLESTAAARLTARLFARLKPGGRLLLANFLLGAWEAPYMEAFMDWHLLYRSKREIREFTREIDSNVIASTHFWIGPMKRIGYLEIVRR
jgi:extracellular factor (EF) 3-hydroxypalmitic acid methyl ester biosynthesis protein